MKVLLLRMHPPVMKALQHTMGIQLVCTCTGGIKDAVRPSMVHAGNPSQRLEGPSSSARRISRQVHADIQAG